MSPKKLFLGLAALIPGCAFSATYYMSPTGNDANAGTSSAPFKTMQRAQDVAVSGDTVRIFGGTYSGFAINSTDANYNYVHVLSKSGVTFVNNDTTKPVFDFSAVSTSLRVCGFLVSGSNIKIVGIEVKGVKVGTQKQSECFRVTGDNNTFNILSIHDNQANGIYFTGHSTGNLVQNCDSYNNIGLTNSVGNTDGYGSHSGANSFLRCRAWNNSDDGYDCLTTYYGAVSFQECWAYNHKGGGDKNGFKIGGFGSGTVPGTVYSHTVTKCLSALNGANGFYANHQPAKSADWNYNTAYGNGVNYNMLERVSSTDATDIAGTREVLHNNIAYTGTIISNENVPAANKTNNSWTKSGVTVSSADFQSVDYTQITSSRTSAGSLPTITFMKLVSGSDLAGMGY